MEREEKEERGKERKDSISFLSSLQPGRKKISNKKLSKGSNFGIAKSSSLYLCPMTHAVKSKHVFQNYFLNLNISKYSVFILFLKIQNSNYFS